MSGTESVSLIPGVGSESLSWAVQHSHQGKPSSSEGGSLKIYGRRGGSGSGVVRRLLTSGGESTVDGLVRLFVCVRVVWLRAVGVLWLLRCVADGGRPVGRLGRTACQVAIMASCVWVGRVVEYGRLLVSSRLGEWMGAGCVWYPPRRLCLVDRAERGVLELRRSDKIERRRSVPGGTSPEVGGGLDEGCVSGVFWRANFWVGFGG